MIAALRSLLFAAGYTVLTVIISVTVLTVFWALPQHRRNDLYGLWCRLAVTWARISCGIRYEVEGKIPDTSEQPVVIVANHQSTWETIFLYHLVGATVPILKKELLNIPFWGWAMRLQKPIAIDRSRPREASRSLLSQGRDRLRNGFSILVFPEGTRRQPGRVGRFARSGAQLAASTGAPILPILHDAGKCWPKGSWIKRPGTIRVRIGELIPAEGRRARDLAETCDHWFDEQMPALKLKRDT